MTDLWGNEPITEFQGKYRFLSNFWPAEILVHMGDKRHLTFSTVEHAYQAYKTKDPEWQVRIQKCGSPGKAKRLGRVAPLREDWDKIKRDVMHNLVFEKFFTHPNLRQLLLDTGDRVIEEGNSWGDKYWGISPAGSGQGENHLGKIFDGRPRVSG